jgi:hypothetical protein
MELNTPHFIIHPLLSDRLQVARFDTGRESRPVPRSSIVRAAVLACVLSEIFLGTQVLAGQKHLASNPEAYLGQVVDNGHCVKFVQAVAMVPRTVEWRAGALVRGNKSIPPGTAIATFGSNGKYTSETGNHAAIYISQDETGIRVYDQWRGQPVHERLIRFGNSHDTGKGSKSNNGNLYSVILTGPGTEMADVEQGNGQQPGSLTE